MRYALFGFILMGCVADTPLYQNHYARITDYKIAPDVITPRGVAVDQSGFKIDLENVDAMINETEQCLIGHFEEMATFCEKEKSTCQEILKNQYHYKFWQCYDISVGCKQYQRIKDGFDRSEFRIKIAPNWRYACDQTTMVFPCRIDPQACRNKGLEPTPECPCSCRSTVQGYDIITTPQFQVLAGELVRLTTGFNNPWNVPPLAQCANISP